MKESGLNSGDFLCPFPFISDWILGTVLNITEFQGLSLPFFHRPLSHIYKDPFISRWTEFRGPAHVFSKSKTSFLPVPLNVQIWPNFGVAAANFASLISLAFSSPPQHNNVPFIGNYFWTKMRMGICALRNKGKEGKKEGIENVLTNNEDIDF